MPDERMHEDDATHDGLPRFIYGEYTGEMRLPEQPADDGEDEAAAGAMDRKTKILVASGGVALVFIVGLVIAALSTGGAGQTPAAANAESPAASVSSGVPSPTEAPGGPSPTWAMAPTDVNTDGGSAKPTKTTKPATTPAAPTTAKPTKTTKAPKPPTGKPSIIFPPPR